MKRLLILTTLIPLFLASPLWAGKLVGKVKNGTEGFSLRSGMTVELNRYQNNQLDSEFKASATVDEAGKFMFENLPQSSTAFYEPVVTYQNVKYYGDVVQLTKDQSRATSQVAIYETTHSDSALTAVRHHFLISPAEGFASIREVVVLQNRSDRTYVGNQATSGGKFRTLQYRLPEGASQLQLGKGLMSCCVEQIEDGFYDTMEIQPGKKEVVFSYRLDTPDEMLQIDKPVTISTASFDVFPMDPALQISSEQLTETPMSNSKFTRYAAAGLAPLSSISFQISGLTGKPLNLSALFLAGFFGLLLIGGGYVWLRSRSTSPKPGAEGEDLETTDADYESRQSREELIREIAELDEAYEGKKIEGKDYQERRNELKARLKSNSD